MSIYLGGARRRRAYPPRFPDTSSSSSSEPAAFPDGPPADGALAYYKGQDGGGATVVSADSSGNGYNSTATGVYQRPGHPLVKNFFQYWFGALPTFPDTGVVVPIECSFEMLTVPPFADTNYIFGELGRDFVGIRRNGNTFYAFTTVWVALPNLFDYTPANKAHIHTRRTAGTLPGDAKVELFVNGLKVYTSADFTPLASGTTSRLVPSGINMPYSHAAFWTSPLTDAQIETRASYFT